MRRIYVPTWLARSVVCGYFASTAMLFAVLCGYVAVMILSTTHSGWTLRLTGNTLTMAVQNAPYLAVSIHFLAGILFALAYTLVYSPRVTGPDWQKGVLFSMILCALSLVVFFPLLGAGVAGFKLGAGPLPLLGNMLVHAVYGLTLALSDAYLARLANHPAWPKNQFVLDSARGGSLGILWGGIAGFVVSQFALYCAAFGGPGLPAIWVQLAGATAGSALGCLVGLTLSGSHSGDPQALATP